jgi:hypothetical protein
MIMFPASNLPQINLPKSRVYRQTLGGEREREREREMGEVSWRNLL